MNRLGEFFSYISNNEGVRDVSFLLQHRTSNPFNEASEKIAASIQLIQESIQETSASFIDQYNAILSYCSSMSDDERQKFIQETNDSIQEIENCITDLAKNVNDGKMRLKGQAIEHSVAVFQILDKQLNQARRDLDYLRLQRYISLNRSKNANTPAAPPLAPQQMVRKYAATVNGPIEPAEQMPEINEQYQRALLQEHDNIVAELIDFNSQVRIADEKVENIGLIVSSYNELLASQNQQLRVIQSQVEQTQSNYQEAHTQLKIAIDKAQMKHLMLAIIVFIMGLLLLYKAF